jgi:hypothetical protein
LAGSDPTCGGVGLQPWPAVITGAYWNEGDPHQYGGWIPGFYLDYQKNFVDNAFV